MTLRRRWEVLVVRASIRRLRLVCALLGHVWESTDGEADAALRFTRTWQCRRCGKQRFETVDL